ncbi:MAG: hypothetical protein RLZZ574_2861 [Cyanobacteriota bacterium]|jgi:hypothetical protein
MITYILNGVSEKRTLTSIQSPSSSSKQLGGAA